MNGSWEQVEMIFRCDREAIPGSLKACMEMIRSKTLAYPVSESDMSRIKWVITELLTNAVKHSGEENTILKITFGPEMLVVEKTDSGKPLVLSGQDGTILQWPLPQNAESIDFTIYHNGMDSLCVRAHDNSEAHFFVQQLEDIAMPLLLTDTSEHFGLLIMTKASDGFTYSYDSENGTNHFVCTFRLVG